MKTLLALAVLCGACVGDQGAYAASTGDTTCAALVAALSDDGTPPNNALLSDIARVMRRVMTVGPRLPLDAKDRWRLVTMRTLTLCRHYPNAPLQVAVLMAMHDLQQSLSGP